MGPGRVATQSVVQSLLGTYLAAMSGMVACPPRPSKVGVSVRSGQAESLYAPQKALLAGLCGFFPARWMRVCALRRYRAGVWLREVFVSRVFVGGCVFVSGSRCLVCTSPEASCVLQPTGARSSELFLCVLSVTQPVERSVAHSVGPRSFCPSGPQLLCLSPLCLEQPVFACACSVDLGDVAAWTGGGRCSLRKRA